MDAEPLVLPGRRTGLGQQLLKTLLALGGELVDDLRIAGSQRQRRVAGPRPVLGDQPLAEQLLEARVERAVGERAEHAEQCVEPLAQLVAVHRGLVEQPEHGELEHARALPSAIGPPRRSRCLDLDVSLQCIGSIHRKIRRPGPHGKWGFGGRRPPPLTPPACGAGPAMRPRPVVGYGPAKRTTLAELRSGSPTRDDACDAHPCPLRAAGCHGEPAGGPGPVRRREPLAHVTYVHGDAPGSRRRTRQVGGRAGRDGPRIRRIQGLCGGSVSKLRMEPPGDVVRPRPRGAGPAR